VTIVHATQGALRVSNAIVVLSTCSVAPAAPQEAHRGVSAEVWGLWCCLRVQKHRGSKQP
jgi:hypothetical protein